MRYPAPRKAGDAPVYAPRSFSRPCRWGHVIFGDFGAAVPGSTCQAHDAQLDVHRSPKILLSDAWSYPVDIWHVDTMVSQDTALSRGSCRMRQIWDVYEGRHLFSQHSDESGYITAVRLAKLFAMLGPPPLKLLKRGLRSNKLFDEEGE